MHYLLHNDVCGALGFLFYQKVHRIWNLLQEYMDNFQVLRFHRYLRYLPDPALMQLPDALSPDSVQYCLHLRIQVHGGQILRLPSAFPDRFQDMESYVPLHTVLPGSFLLYLCFRNHPEPGYHLHCEAADPDFSLSVLRNQSSQALPWLCRKFRHVSVPLLH